MKPGLLLYLRKRRTSPNQAKPTSSKRKQKLTPTEKPGSGEEEEEEEEEEAVTRDPPAANPTTSQVAALFPDNGAPSSVSIAALTSALPRPPSHQNEEEEDYDE